MTGRKTEYKKLLIVGHNCLSKSGSNGRTLANYLQGWPKEKLAQLYIHAELPDFEICNRYFCITDSSVVKSLLKRKPAGYIVKPINEKKASTTSSVKKKNSLLFLMREFAWRSKLWNSHDLSKWVAEFQPERILVQAGDAGFLFKIAEDISRKYNAPLIVYNTEGYYFKDVSYFSENIFSKYCYPFLHWTFKKAYDSLVAHSKTEIYNCNLLQADYKAVYHNKSYVIMNTSEFTQEEVFRPKKKRMIYAGNLGLSRHKSLIEFARALHDVDKNMYVDVYGKIPNDQIAAELNRCKQICFHGFISYEELKQELRESQYLLHVESFDSFYKEDLKYAFSTKIADSLASGGCLFVYAPENMAVCNYLKGTDAAVLITKRDKLVQSIKAVLEDEDKCATISRNGRELAEKNHNIKKNREKFQKLLLN